MNDAHDNFRSRHRALAAIATGLLQVGRWLGDLVVPTSCLACQAPLADRDALCAACWRQIVFIRPPLCDRLGIPLPFDTGGRMVSAAALADPPDYDRARAALRFDSLVRDMVHAYKYNDRHVACRLFARLMAGAAADLLPGTDLIVPVPLHRLRLLQRRFNQAAELARALSQLSGTPADPLVLVRTRKTTSQVGLSADQRRRNVSGAFAVPPDRHATLAGRNVLLVDDVVTTGATVNACARVLRRAGAARVDVVALARVVNDVHVSP